MLISIFKNCKELIAKNIFPHRVNSFMQSLLQKVSFLFYFYYLLHPINNEDKMIPSVADCINEFTQ